PKRWRPGAPATPFQGCRRCAASVGPTETRLPGCLPQRILKPFLKVFPRPVAQAAGDGRKREIRMSATRTSNRHAAATPRRMTARKKLLRIVAALQAVLLVALGAALPAS